MESYIKMFIDFCYADLKNRSTLEKRRLFDELIGNLYEINFLAMATNSPIPSLKKIWPVFEHDQSIALNFIDWLFDNKGFDYALTFMMPYTFMIGGGETAGIFAYREAPFFLKVSEEEQAVKARYDIEVTIAKSEYPYRAIAKAIYPFIVIKFLKALDNKGTGTILRCPKCTKIFFNPTKRKQVYCSTKCRALAGVHRARKKQRQLKKRQKNK